MSELAQLQRTFAAALDSAAAAQDATAAFRGEAASVLHGLAVYRGNMVGACGKALAGIYPVVAKIVGESFFEGLAREYLRRHPSHSGDLNEFGDKFAQFVADFPHTQDLPYLPDVARMEWLVHRAYYANDAEPLALARLAALGDDEAINLRLVLAPACALFESRWPLARLWKIHQDGYAGAMDVDFAAEIERILIHRPAYRVQVSALSAGAYRFLAGALAGESLAQALDPSLAEDPDFDLANSLREWVAIGVIADIVSGDETCAAH